MNVCPVTLVSRSSEELQVAGQPAAIHEFKQPPGNLAERAVFDGLDEFGEDVSTAFDGAREGVERTRCLRGVAAFEYP